LLLLIVAVLSWASLYTASAEYTIAKKSLVSTLGVSYLKTNLLTVNGNITFKGGLAIYTITLEPLGCIALVESTAISLMPYTGGGIYYVSVPDDATFAECSGIMTRTVTMIAPAFNGTFTVTQRGVTSYVETLDVTVPLYYVYTETVYWTQVLDFQVIASGEYNCSSIVQTLSFNIPQYEVNTKIYTGKSSVIVTMAPACPGSLLLVEPTAYLATPIPLTPQLSLNEIFQKVNLNEATERGGVPLVGALLFLGALLGTLRRRALT